VLGRQAFRFRFALSQDTSRPAQPPPAGYQAGDSDTAARQGFLRGATVRAAAGELAVDAETGAPLQARLSATFDAGDPAGQGPRSPGDGTPLTVAVVVSGQMKAFGGEVKAIAAPSAALLDERKPAGPATALEAAGLKKRGEEGQVPEPADEGE